MTHVKCPVVGIGASAGGLDALEALFDSLPSDTGAAFVVIQHLDPKHKSMTAEILARHTQMPTVQITDGTVVEADHVYVIPPNAYVTMKDHSFELGEAVLQHGLRLPIDAFLVSLADQHKERAVAIILSGTGSDGTLGIRAINGAGGLVLGQSPETAQYDGMPRAAIATGLVDVVCPPKEMPDHLGKYFAHRYVKEACEDIPAEMDKVDEGALRTILTYLQVHLGYDFRNYKPGTLNRRIIRRMGLHKIDRMADYIAYLRQQPDEAEELVRDLLINVTTFFRDPDAFGALETSIVPKLLAGRADDEPIRVWVPGCASGEEAYSIGMLLIEARDKARKRCPIQIFATDLDGEALNNGRAGIYAEDLVGNISPERLERFFIKEDHHYRVSKRLRESVTFAVQNVITDPPFSRVDLISCRNLLIYLDSDVQQKILGYFHFALREGGYLFLGHSETLGSQEALFKPIDKKWRLFQRMASARPMAGSFPISYGAPRTGTAKFTPAGQVVEKAHLKELIQQQLLHKFAPAAVLTNARYQVLYFLGPTAEYLEQPSGTPTQDLLTLAHSELRTALRTGLKKVVSDDAHIAVETVSVRRGTARPVVKITITRLVFTGQPDPLFLVTFEDKEPERESSLPQEQTKSDPTDSTDSTVSDLQFELTAAREDLQSNIEELESANEELQAANEEVMSVNEELQSTNEEMETSKEELQSMNEELSTVNNQLKDKVEQLAEANDDLSNFVASTGIATLFLDSEKRIQRFTPATRRLFHLLMTDIGRPFIDIRAKFKDDTLFDDIDAVLGDFHPRELEITTEDGAWYLRRIMPYRTLDNRIDGVVITCFEITERLRNEQKLHESEERFRKLIEDAPDPMIVVDENGAIVLANTQAVLFFGYGSSEILDMPVEKLIPQGLRARHAENRKGYLSDPKVRKMGAGLDLSASTKRGDRVPVEVNLSPIPTDDGLLVIASIRDISERKIAEKEVLDAKSLSDTALAAKSRFLATASHDLRQPLQSLGILNETLLKSVEDPEAQRLLKLQDASLGSVRTLLNSLLDISKLDAGTMSAVMADVELLPILEEVVAMYRSQAEEKGLAVDIQLEAHAAHTDPELLKQLLLNLFGNAVRYTENGGVKLICTSAEEGVRIEVLDSGPGIPVDELPHIFEEFYQVGRDPQQRHGGLGLGLAITKRIAAVLGTRIDTKSTVGQGSSFSVLIPANETEPEATIRSPEPPKAQGGKKTVLLIDDEPAVLDSTEALLSFEHGLDISAAASAEAALGILDDLEPDVIVTDMHLGGGPSGLDIINEARKRAGRPIPAILITGDTSADITDAKPHDVQLLTKPTDTDVLVQTLRRLIGVAGDE